MDRAKPGHTVEFHGLQGAAHLNGTCGTLVEFHKNAGRWAVRCERDGNKVMAKPANLTLIRVNSSSRSGTKHHPMPAAMRSTASADGHPSAWAKGLSNADQYEWFSNCYQMRCDDEYAWGGGSLRGPYDPDATPESIAEDFLVYCLLAKRQDVVPNDWDWPAFLKTAAEYVPFAFEKSDAKERWGTENVFVAAVGGRSLRYTAEQIYASSIQDPNSSQEQHSAERDVFERNAQKVQKELGGVKAWTTFVNDLGRSRRFTGF